MGLLTKDSPYCWIWVILTHQHNPTKAMRKDQPQNKNCTIKIHFIRTNRIQDDDENRKGKICKKNGRKNKKN